MLGSTTTRRRPENRVLCALDNSHPLCEVQSIIHIGTDLNLLGPEAEELGSLVITGLYMGLLDAILTAILSHLFFQQVNRCCPESVGTALHIAAAMERKSVAYCILERHDLAVATLFVKDKRGRDALSLCR